MRVAYEAGPTGFGLARALAGGGVGCVVAAPGKIERPAQDRVKTDRRDAERLVRLLMVGGLHPVRVPGSEEEALRDLVRAREDVRGDLMRARHRVGKLLLRHDVRFDGPATGPSAISTGWAGSSSASPWRTGPLLDYVGAIDALLVAPRRASRPRSAALVPGSPWAQTVDRLRCLRGIDTLSALGLCAEVGDFERFDAPAQLMSYLGLVPSEHSSGEARRQGAITKSGSRHARRLLVEAAWHYRRRPAPRAPRSPPPGRPAPGGLRDLLARPAAAASQLAAARIPSAASAARSCAVAVARELAGFCWAISTDRD